MSYSNASIKITEYPESTEIPVVEITSACQSNKESFPSNLNQNVNLILASVDMRALTFAVEIFDSIFEEGETRENEYVATNTLRFNAYLGRYKFNLITAEWGPELMDQALQKYGRGMISFMAFMNDCSALEAATDLKNWLDYRCQTESDKKWFNRAINIESKSRDLIGIEALYQDTEAPVILCSNEEAAYAVRFLMPTCIGIGTKRNASVDRIDFTILKGRSVIIWGDHDEAGRRFEDSVAAVLIRNDRKANVFKLKPLMFLPVWAIDSVGDGINELPNEGQSIFDLKVRDEELPSGYNAADAFAEGWSSEKFSEVFFKLIRPVQFTFQMKKIGNFLLKEDGIYEIKYRDGEECFSKISSLVEVTALTRDERNHNWGLLLRFTDRDGHEHEWAMPKEMLATKDEYRQILFSKGVDIYPAGINKLPEYFVEANPSGRALCVNSIGWHRGVFVLPEKTYGTSDERVILQNANARKASSYSIKGTLAQWRDSVGNKCVNNSRMILAACVSLTGPFLESLKLENGGFHFRGQSSSGKTKTLTVAGSIWGGKTMVKLWRGTGNAIEGIAREHHNTVLLLDELAQVNPQEAGAMAYTLGNGQTKARANVNGDTKEVTMWRLLFISTGEIGLAEHVAEGGGSVRAGQEIRMLDIPSDANSGMGVFEDIHGAENASTFADSLQSLCESFYGSPADALLTKLTEQDEMSRAVKCIQEHQTRFVRQYVPDGSHGQISRAAARFGAVAGVGEYCISIGVLPWSAGHAVWGVSKCYTAWLESRGNNSASEEIRALAQVREFIERNGESRFTMMQETMENNVGQRTINRAGFRRVQDGSMEYWILPEMYQKEVCHGMDTKLVTRVLKDKNFLELDSAGKSSVSKLVPGIGRMRVYVIKSSLMQAA